MKRVLVTGGAGFIGSHSVDLLLQHNLEVVVVDNLETGKLSNLDLFHPHLRLIQNDILHFPTLIAEISRCDAVLHLAALPSVPKSIENPVQSLKVNTLGFVHVLQAIRELKKPMRLVYASSAAVYGNAESLPCSDEIALSAEALSPYALEKANDERYAALYAKLFGISSVGLRYFNVYGPRQDPNSAYSGVISKLIERYQKNETLTIFGDGEQSRDFIHVSDIARANLLALQSNYVGVLNIATGVPETLNNIIAYIEKLGGTKAKIAFASAREGDIAHSYASAHKAEDILNFRSMIKLDEGLQSVFLF